MRRLILAAAVLLAAAIAFLVPTVLSAPAAGSGFALSSALAVAPRCLVAVAVQAGRLTGQDPNVLLAVAKVETSWGQAQTGQPDDLVPADLLGHIDQDALAPGGATAVLLGLAGGRRVGDWVNPQAAGVEHAVGFMQLLPSTWRTESAAAPGWPEDPYRPLDAMVTAALLPGQAAERRRGRPEPQPARCARHLRRRWRLRRQHPSPRPTAGPGPGRLGAPAWSRSPAPTSC